MAEILKTTDDIMEHTLGHENPVFVEYKTGTMHWAMVHRFDIRAGSDYIHMFSLNCAPLKLLEDGTYWLHEISYPMSGYLKTWRCWTERPTPEQMTAEPWVD